MRESVVTLGRQNDENQRAKFDANDSNSRILINVLYITFQKPCVLIDTIYFSYKWSVYDKIR